jgi:hypothetical protein
VNEAQLDSAKAGLRRLGVPGAIRAVEHLELAVEAWHNNGTRWEERMSYSLREALEEIPPLFGQPRQGEPIVPIARRFLEDLNDLIDVPPESPPDPETIRALTTRFQESVDDAGTARRYRVAQAIIVQAGTGRGSPQVESFAEEWADVVQGANTLLHRGTPSEEDPQSLLERGVTLLSAMVGPMSDRLEEVDALGADPDPSEATVQTLIHLLADDRLARYFFTNASSPAWLHPLDHAGFFDSPMKGEWYQGSYLLRVSDSEPTLAKDILVRIARDEHPAAATVVVQISGRLGPECAPILADALARPGFTDPWRVANALEELLQDWSRRGITETFPIIADRALQPQVAPGSVAQVIGKFPEFNFQRLVQLIVAGCDCDHIGDLARILGYKVRWLIGLTDLGALRVSMTRDRINQDDHDDRDVSNALVSGMRDALRRMRDCGESLESRKAALGPIDNELTVRLWAGHLAEEEALGQ